MRPRSSAHLAPADTQSMNSLMVIHPYRYEGMWVFDDERVGLQKEPFVESADPIIDHYVAGISDAAQALAPQHVARDVRLPQLPPGPLEAARWLGAVSGVACAARACARMPASPSTLRTLLADTSSAPERAMWSATPCAPKPGPPPPDGSAHRPPRCASACWGQISPARLSWAVRCSARAATPHLAAPLPPAVHSSRVAGTSVTSRSTEARPMSHHGQLSFSEHTQT